MTRFVRRHATTHPAVAPTLFQSTPGEFLGFIVNPQTVFGAHSLASRRRIISAVLFDGVDGLVFLMSSFTIFVPGTLMSVSHHHVDPVSASFMPTMGVPLALRGFFMEETTRDFLLEETTRDFFLEETTRDCFLEETAPCASHHEMHTTRISIPGPAICFRTHWARARAVELYLKYKVKGSVERIFSALPGP